MFYSGQNQLAYLYKICIIDGMVFEWDQDKNESNRKKHGSTRRSCWKKHLPVVRFILMGEGF